MYVEALIKAIQMLSTDVANLTTNLAMTKGTLDVAKEKSLTLRPDLWGQPEASEGAMAIVQVPLTQYQAILQLLDALS